MKFFRKKTLVIEAISPIGWEDAARRAVRRAKETDQQFELIKIKSLELVMDDDRSGEVKGYKAIVKLSNRR
jgi:flavin-binding protein dodecin